MNILRRQLKWLAPRGVEARLKLARLGMERRLYTRRIDHREFRQALLDLGEWRSRSVWVQASLNDFYNVDMKPSDIIETMLDLVGPSGTLMMPAFPLNPDPSRVLLIDSAPASTGLMTEMFRRLPEARRSIHLYSSVAALGTDAEWLTEAHHLDVYPWGESSPYGRLAAQNGLMVGLGVVPLGFTPLHKAECDLHREIPVFQRALGGDPVTYGWRRRSGESGTHTTFRRAGRIRPERLVRHLPSGVLTRFRRSNLTFQAAAAGDAIDALKALARRGKTIYWGL